MEMTKKVLGLGAVAAVAFACWLPAQSNAASADASQAKSMHHGKVMCYGVNRCKGKSACKTAGNKCKGANACKGKGGKMMSAKKCLKKGGHLTDNHQDHH